ncbi:uncharacterized protein METZ01_LOCUS44939, partial [marine metagenome]
MLARSFSHGLAEVAVGLNHSQSDSKHLELWIDRLLHLSDGVDQLPHALERVELGLDGYQHPVG